MSIISYLEKKLSNRFIEFIEKLEDDATKAIMYRINYVKKIILREIMTTIILIAAIIFLSISAIFFFIEFLGLNKTLSFLSIGVVFLLIGIIIKSMK